MRQIHFFCVEMVRRYLLQGLPFEGIFGVSHHYFLNPYCVRQSQNEEYHTESGGKLRYLLKLVQWSRLVAWDKYNFIEIAITNWNTAINIVPCLRLK